MKRRLALGLGGIGVALAVGGLATRILLGVSGSLFEAVGNDLAGTMMVLLGALIALRRPENPIGWLLLSGGLLFAQADLTTLYETTGRPPGLPGADVALALGGFAWIPTIGLMLIFVTFYFPTGRLLSRRWTWIVRASAVAMAVAYVLNTVTVDPGDLQIPGATNPLRVSGVLFNITSTLAPLALLTIPITAILAVLSLVIRYRRSGSLERHQIRVLMVPVGLYAVAFVLDEVVLVVTGQGLSWLETVGSLGIFGVPVGAGIAVLRYRLYDIDIVISRALVYGSLALFITAVYVAIVVGLGTLVGSGNRPNIVLSIVATALVAVVFQPLRERLQQLANRLVYGRRATPYEVLSDFSERVAASYSSDQVLPRMAQVLAEGTGATRADVWLRSGEFLRPGASHPEDSVAEPPVPVTGQLLPGIPGSDRAVEVRYQGELLGALTVSKRVGESLTPIEEKLLDDLARQAGLVLKNVGLTAELLARLDDLRASRQRLVAAQDQARRRLERNLHDGAQQNLVALKVKIGLAELIAEKDPVKAQQLVTELQADVDETIETVRDLARGIYPPLLAEEGLGVALQAQARRATIPVDLVNEGVGRYPQELEAAVYFCVLEALQNVQKYAAATRVVVRLSDRGNNLHFEVEDDGRGFDMATVTRGAGLTNITDRLEALGGSLQITSAPGRGTTIAGILGSAGASL